MVKREISVWLAALALGLPPCRAVSAGEGAPPPAATAGEMRNAKLKDIPPNTWVKIRSEIGMSGGSAEVTWCYDSDRKRIVRVGGCTDTYSNEIWSFDVGTETWTNNVKMVPKNEKVPPDRPGRGCNRGLCYDPDNKCIWTYGGASSYAPGRLGLWKGTDDLGLQDVTKDWKHIEGVPNVEQGGAAYDPATKKLVLHGQNMATQWTTRVFEPAGGKARPVVNGPNDLAEFPSFLLVPELKGVMLIAGQPGKWEDMVKAGDKRTTGTWLFDTRTETWRDLQPKNPPSWRKAPGASYDSKNHVVIIHGGVGYVGGKDVPLNDTWAYLPAENAWVELKPRAAPYSGDGSMLLAYDPEHDVHVLGKTRGWQAGSVWVYRYGNPPTAGAEKSASK